MDEMPPVRYAKSGNVHIAYVSAGEGPEQILITPGITSHVESLWASSWLQELLPHARVTWFDKRGTGASDRDASFTFEERIDDLRAVMDAARISTAHLVGVSEGGPMSILFAAMYPDRARSLTIYGSFAAWMRKADYPHGMNLSLREYSRWLDRVEGAYIGEAEALQWMADTFAPSMATDPAFRALMQAGLRLHASPGAARALWEMLYEVDVRHVLPTIRVPTTIVHYTGDRVCPVEGGRYMAAHIPGATLVELPGDDHFRGGGRSPSSSKPSGLTLPERTSALARRTTAVWRRCSSPTSLIRRPRLRAPATAPGTRPSTATTPPASASWRPTTDGW